MLETTGLKVMASMPLQWYDLPAEFNEIYQIGLKVTIRGQIDGRQHDDLISLTSFIKESRLKIHPWKAYVWDGGLITKRSNALE
jgi:hypothetical protein